MTMTTTGRRCGFWMVASAFLSVLAMSTAAYAQTSGAVGGVVRDQTGGAIPGATARVTHEPTGTVYETISDALGNYTTPNVRVGGPYTVRVTLQGFKDGVQSDVFVKLGAQATVNFELQLLAVAESVTVVAEANSIINPARMGTGGDISGETLRNLPSLGQGINDFVRTNPYFQTADGRGGLVVVGKNYRYNAIQIDGAVTNDLFGLSSSGAPGGGAGTNPISLDSLDEIQLVVAPFDVRLGGFTGGGINAVTKSGTNQVRGGAYYFSRNQDLTGDGPLERPLAAFTNRLYGASVGGPVTRNRAFFFTTLERTQRNSPSGFSVTGNSGVAFGKAAEIQQIVDTLQSRYGFNAGGLEEVDFERSGNKIFGRVDVNFGPRHRLVARHSYVKGRDEQFGTLSTQTYSLPGTLYGLTNKTNSTVVQLNSSFGTRHFNELRVVYTTVRDFRDFPQRFPTVQVFFADGTSVYAGTERSSHANTLNQDSVEVTNDYTLYAGQHAITIGTHNEFFEFGNLFTGQLFGEYQFNSLERFLAGFAQGYTRNFSRTSDPLEQARFGVRQWGFYVGDQWRARPNLSVQFGGRVDLPRLTDRPLENPRTEELFGYATDVIPSPTQFSPRLGFNWDVNGDGRQQVRGGVGIFTGRTPYVWLSNNYIGTGIQFANLFVNRTSNGGNNAIPFNPDPDNQPTQIGNTTGAASNQYAFVDPDFKFPSVLRYNLAYDRQLGFGGLVTTVEFLYADNLQDILYKNVNLRPTGATAFDGRPMFARVDSATSAAYLLTNTTEGTSSTVSFKVERPSTRGIYLTASYLYNYATSVNDGTSSTAASQFGNNPVSGDPNAPTVTLSNYSTGHRVTLAATYTRALWGGSDVAVSLFYNGQSGQPFKYIFATGNDINGDQSVGTASGVNDLLYVPRSEDEVIIQGGTWADLDAFIEGDAGLRNARGQIIERNASRLPWRNAADLRLAVNLPARGPNIELSLDVQNVLNLFSKTAGRVEEEFFPGRAPIRFNGLQGGKPVYELLFTNPSFTKGSFVDLPSRWQAQLGARIRF